METKQRSRRVLIAASVSLVLLALAGLTFFISRDGSEVDGPTSKDVAAARAWLARQEGSYAQVTLSLLARRNVIAARVKVTSIEGPLWNSSDGRAWEGNDEVNEVVLSRVHVDVEDTLRGTGLPSSFVFTTSGDASRRYQGEEAPPSAYSSGGFVAGESFIVFVGREGVPYENGTEESWVQAGGFQANWQIRGDDAVAPVAAQSLKLATLLERIRAMSG